MKLEVDRKHTALLVEQKAEARANICRTPDVTEQALPVRSVGPLMNALTFLLINMLHQMLPGALGGVTV